MLRQYLFFTVNKIRAKLYNVHGAMKIKKEIIKGHQAGFT